MEDTDDDDLPEALRLHEALAVAILALELIANGEMHHPVVVAFSALNLLRKNHPDSREHMTSLSNPETNVGDVSGA